VVNGEIMSLEKVDKADFNDKVIKSDKIILVDFWAEWCGPCRSLAPILEEVAGEVADKANIVKCNVDDNGDLAQQYGIRGIPTMIFFKNGEAAKTLVGVQPKEEIKKTIEELSQ
jgi:thioredoxin 1